MPTKPYSEVKVMLGNAASAWEKLMSHIRYYYEMDEIWQEGKPTHKHRNILYIKRSGKALIALGLREGYFAASIVLGKAERDKFDLQRETFSDPVTKEYDETEILHDGAWLSFDVYDDSIVDDFIRLVEIKRKPNRKVLPGNIEMCGVLDIGLSHSEITEKLFSNGESL